METRYLELALSRGSVDLESRTIKNVIVGEQIAAKDYRRFKLDDEGMDEVVALAAGQEIAVEYDHNWSGMGKKLGFITNVRREAKTLVGDMKILASADLSPSFPNMGTYILQSVSENAKTYSLSMKFKESKFMGLRAGKKVEVEANWNWDKGYHYVYKDTRELHETEVFPRFQSLKSIDVVGEGALTNRMLRASTDEEFISTFNHIFQDPEMKERFASCADQLVISQFYNQHSQQNQESRMGFIKSLKNLLGMETSQTQVTATTQNETTPPVTPETQTAAAEAKPKTEDVLAQMQETMKGMQETINAQAAKIAELEKKPIATHVGENGVQAQTTVDESKIPAYKRNPINARLYQNQEN